MTRPNSSTSTQVSASPITVVRIGIVTGWVHKDHVQPRGALSGLTVTWTPPQLSLKATTTANLSVRSGSSTSYGKVGTIASGSTTRHDILGKNAATATR